MRFVRVLATAALLAAVGLVAPPAASAALSFTDLPHLDDESAVAGTPARFTASAAFPGEEWIGFEWTFEGGEIASNQRYFSSQATDVVLYAFQEPGEYTVTCVAYHGWKSGVFGVGPYKYRRTAKFDLEVLPKLPLTVGVLTIDGTGITKNENGTYEIKGPSSVNTIVQIENGVTVDLEKKTVKFDGALDVPLAGKYKDVLSAVGDIVIDANTGGFVEASLPDLEPEFEFNDVKIKFSAVKILNPGIEFDFELTVPRFAEGDPNRCPEVPGGDPPTEEDEDNEEDPDDLIQVTLKKVRIDTVAPYLHAGAAATVKLSNLSIPRTNWGLEEFEFGYEVEPKEKFFGTLNLCFPSKRSLGGTFEIVDGELEKLGFTAGLSIPIYTFSGGLGDAIYLKQLSAEIRGLSGDEPNPVVAAGAFDEGTGAVSEPGIKLTWGIGLPAAGAVEEIVTLNGAAEFDAFWNIAVGGSLVLLEEEFEDRFRVASVVGRYQNRETGGIWSLSGLLEFDGKVSLQGVFTTSFAPEDAYVIARARGTVTLPEDHWARRFVPTGSGDVVLMIRATPLDRRIVGFRLTFNVPVLGEKGTAFQFNLRDGSYAFDLDEDVVAALGPGKAESKSATLTGGQGASGLVVRLTSATGTPAFNLRKPDDTLLTPASGDGVTVAYAEDAAVHQAVYLVANAADGTYTAEFDDAGLGAYEVTFLLPGAAPTLAVTGPAADTTVGRYDTPHVQFDASGFDTTSPVRVYLESTTEEGQRYNVGGATNLGSEDLAMNLSKVPPGTWRASVEVDDPDGVPAIALGTSTLTVVEHLGLDVKKGAINDLATRGKDSFTASGSLVLTGAAPAKLFDPATESLTLTLGGGASPYVLNVPAGSPGWKASPKGALSWKSAKGALPKVTFKLDPVKRTFSVSVKSLDFRGAQANPIAVDLVLGNDRASESSAWTVVAGKGFKLP